jgi:hypothetical protein
MPRIEAETWDIKAETALVASLVYVPAVVAAAVSAAVGAEMAMTSAAVVAAGALGALAGVALSAAARILFGAFDLDLEHLCMVDLGYETACASVDAHASTAVPAGTDEATRYPQNPDYRAGWDSGFHRRDNVPFTG